MFVEEDMIYIIQTVFEFAVVGFIVWGVFNEQKLVDFEEKVKAHRRRRKLRVIECSGENPKKHCV